MTARSGPDLRSAPGPGDLHAQEGVALIRQRCSLVPEAAVVLGSGLGEAVMRDLRADHEFAFEGLPGFPPASVPGHAGRLVMGELYGVPAAVFRGRVHLYEGHGAASTTLIPRLAAALGAGVLVLTNAAGGLDPRMSPGGLMLLRDHLNFLGLNPLSGWRLPSGEPAFVDVSAVYDAALMEMASAVAARAGVPLSTGVYAALPGPTYETPSEAAFLRLAGATAVGMSTVPEAVAAVALGMRVLAISCVTNAAGARSSHDEVLASARLGAEGLGVILAGVLPSLAGERTDERHE